MSYYGLALVHVTAAAHPATIRLPAPHLRRGGVALADGESRELLFQLVGMALGAFRRLLAEKDRLESVTASLATIFKNRHR